MKKHTLSIMLALLFTGGAFAQNSEKLKPASSEIEGLMAENNKNGLHYSEGLTKEYQVVVNADSYADGDDYFRTKTSEFIESDLGYQILSSKIEISENEKRIAVFKFFGEHFSDFSYLKQKFTDYGFEVIEVSGILR